MNTTTFTQLSESEIRALFRAELEAFFGGKLPTVPIEKDRPSLGGLDLAVEVTGLQKPTLYALVHRRQIPFYKRGKKLYFKREELEAWIEEGRKATVKEIDQEVEGFIIEKRKKRSKKQPVISI